MLIHFLKIGFRNLIRNKFFAFLNISGLSLGMACCILIMLWVVDELSVDNFHGNNLYAVYIRTESNGQVNAGYGTPAIMAAELKRSIPEIQYASGFGFPWAHSETFRVGNVVHKFDGSRADADFFQMFNYQLLAGNVKTALSDLNGLAISRKMATMFFGSPQEALGQFILFENRKELVVTAVFDDLGAHSSNKFDYLLNWETLLAENPNLKNSWQAFQVNSYVALSPSSSSEDVRTKLTKFLDGYLKIDNVKFEVALQPYNEVYLQSKFENGMPKGGRIEYVRIFIGVAFFILIIASINFTNLSTARAMKRTKEIGVRKVVGSSRMALVVQFLGESIFLSFFALLLAIIIVFLALPAFNQLMVKEITFPVLRPLYWAALLAVMAVTGILAGTYPALLLSNFQAAKVLKAQNVTGIKSLWLRKGLIVFQFFLSTTMVIVTIVVARQTQFFQSKQLGYDRENVLYILLEGDLVKSYQIFKNKAIDIPGVQYVDRSSETPHAMGFVTTAVNWAGKDANTVVGFKPTSVGYDFVKLMNLQITQGRDFSKDFADSSSFIVNEKAVKEMGMKDPIGASVSIWDKKGKIVGVLKDYHTYSLHQPILPLIVDVQEQLNFGMVLIKTEPGKAQQVLGDLEKIYKELNPNFAFTYSFMDEEYNKMYRSENMITKLCYSFAAIALAISCLGLLGLAMYSTEQRMKEIGIRRVHGSSAVDIAKMLLWDFLKLICLSFLIAVPVSVYLMNQWLQEFAFSIGLSWWIFVVAGIACVAVAMATISYQTIRASLTNPIETLRVE